MAKRKGARTARQKTGGRKSKRAARARKVSSARKKTAKRAGTGGKSTRSGKRPTAKARPSGRAGKSARPSRSKPSGRAAGGGPTPPSSLDLTRRGSAAGTGRAELQQHRRENATMTPGITAGDADANVQSAYFSGDESPGGDHANPDQDVVEEIGRAIGVQYEDAEELKSTEKVLERDRHRWELDPASSEDYVERERRRKK
jgi:hypothetical protein